LQISEGPLTGQPWVDGIRTMFDFLKSPVDPDREFRNWIISDRVRVFGPDAYAEWKANVDDTHIIPLIEESVAEIAIYVRDAQFDLALTGNRMNAHLDGHYKKGAKLLLALLKKQGWSISTSPDERMHGGTIVVDVAKGTRVRW
jgi:hypothetical protein